MRGLIQGGLFRGVHGFIWGHVWFYWGHAWFYSGGMRGLIWGACVVLFRGRMWFFWGVCMVFSVFSDTMRYVNEQAVCILLECILVRHAETATPPGQLIAL